jgi:hypothetical protein
LGGRLLGIGRGAQQTHCKHQQKLFHRSITLESLFPIILQLQL